MLVNGWEVGTQVAAVGSIMAKVPNHPRPTSLRPRVLLGLCLFGAAAALGVNEWVKGLGSAAPAGLAALGSASEQAEWAKHNALALAAHGRGDFTEAVAHQRRAAVAALRAP